MKIQEINKQSVEMRQVYDMVSNLATNDASILIQGEKGTEKALVARAIHLNSSRKNNIFEMCNCSAYPQFMVESGLFGHEIGTFEGAVSQQNGCLQRADEGTTALTDIEKISPMTQFKLLHFLRTKKFQPLGSNEMVETNVRIITVADDSLEREVELGAFDEELYRMLNTFAIRLPALRHRKDDIPLLVEYLIERLNMTSGKKVKGVTSDAMRLLMNYSWPYNVKELENSIQHAFFATESGAIEHDCLPSRMLMDALME